MFISEGGMSENIHHQIDEYRRVVQYVDYVDGNFGIRVESKNSICTTRLMKACDPSNTK